MYFTNILSDLQINFIILTNFCLVMYIYTQRATINVEFQFIPHSQFINSYRWRSDATLQSNTYRMIYAI